MGDSKWATLSMDLMMLVNMSNEIALLFIVILQVTTVNDAADKLGTALSQARWGPHDSEAESRRQNLLVASTFYGPEPGTHSRLGFLSYLVSATSRRPVSFKVLGLRPTRVWVVTFIISLSSAVITRWLGDYVNHFNKHTGTIGDDDMSDMHM